LGQFLPPERGSNVAGQQETQPAFSRRQDVTAGLRKIRKRLIKKRKFRVNSGERRTKRELQSGDRIPGFIPARIGSMFNRGFGLRRLGSWQRIAAGSRIEGL
jgi:hypothetical protein